MEKPEAPSANLTAKRCHSSGPLGNEGKVLPRFPMDFPASIDLLPVYNDTSRLSYSTATGFLAYRQPRGLRDKQQFTCGSAGRCWWLTFLIYRLGNEVRELSISIGLLSIFPLSDWIRHWTGLPKSGDQARR